MHKIIFKAQVMYATYQNVIRLNTYEVYDLTKYACKSYKFLLRIMIVLLRLLILSNCIIVIMSLKFLFLCEGAFAVLHKLICMETSWWYTNKELFIKIFNCCIFPQHLWRSLFYVIIITHIKVLRQFFFPSSLKMASDIFHKVHPPYFLYPVVTEP